MRSFTLYLYHVFVDLPGQMRWSYLPPLMVYMAAGISGLTSIVGTFFIKEFLDLSAAFLAGLGFWVGLPWALKMPLGHLVDLIWRQKNILVYIGAGIIAASLMIMYGLIAHTEAMVTVMPAESWFVISAILAPFGYVVQDVVADAMTVEAVPKYDDRGQAFDQEHLRQMHTMMQTLGRFAIIGGLVLVSMINVVLLSGVSSLTEEARIDLFADIYIMALAIPLISVAGVILAAFQQYRRRLRLSAQKINVRDDQSPKTQVNWTILIGSLVFVLFSTGVGGFNVPYAQEIVFAGSVAIILILMSRLVAVLDESRRLMIVGTAIIVFVFRATPLPGPGLTWFEIDVLLFDEHFISVLGLITSVLTLLGIVLFRPFMANNSIVRIIVILSIIAAVLFLPSLGMYYGLHEWTAAMTGGVVDARFIAIINTALESPLGQVAMIPMLVWIARNAPVEMKATFFAVFASFTNLALSASALGTKYLNQVFTVSREVQDKVTGEVTSLADYSELGFLLITVLLIIFILPIGTVLIIQNTRFRTTD
jgi:MFS family permease